MPDLLFYKKELRLLVCLLAPAAAGAQQADSFLYRELPQVEVVEKARPSVTREGAPIQLLDRAGLERLGSHDLADAVRRFSGVTVNDYGGIGGLKTVSVRSLGAQHTAVSYDGVTVTDAQSGQVDISRFSTDNIENLILSIGQTDDIFLTARMYASAGALSISTRTPAFDGRPVRLEAQARGGSFGLLSPSLRYEQRLGEAYAMSLHAEALRADGVYPYTLRNGDIVTRERRHNSDIGSFRTELNLFSDWRRRGKLKLKGYWFDSDRGLPGAVVLYNDYHTERLRNRNGFVQGVYELEPNSRISLRAQGKFDYSRTRYQDSHSKYIGGKQTDVYTQREYYASTALRWRPAAEGGRLSFSAAADAFFNTLDATTPRSVFPRRFTSLTSLAGQYRDGRLTVTASLLATSINEEVRRGDAAPARRRLSPAASLSWRPLAEHNLRLRASFKDIFRTPTFNDLYYDRIGNRELASEKALQYNLGLTWSGAAGPAAHVSLTADGYYNRVKDKIVAIPTMFIWRMMNMGEVDIRGLDLNLSVRLAPARYVSLQIEGGYSFRKAVDVTDRGSKTYGHQIPYTPRHSGTASVLVETPWVNINWILTAVGSRYALPQNMEANRMDGYAEQQVSASRDFSTGGRSSLRLQAGIVNLTDVTYDVIRYYPMPGRSFRISVKYSY
ncbi:MAG: TonB-dependent receptor [Tannerellaceae bacterium]|jgi:outer membrane cobalamin receptor|nr:TonB-dependent receptor [Tannerellaceae bacterium]